MTVIELPDEQVAALKAKAAAEGLSLEAWLQKLAEQENLVFVERRPEGDYAVRRSNATKASAVLPTQGEAIDRAREMGPD
jgi:plasmid stability protein